MKIRFQRKFLAIPYLLFFLFFLVLPIFLIVYYAFTDHNGKFTFDLVRNFFSDTGKLEVLAISLIFGLLNTIFCLLIGYPVSMLLANKKYNKNAVLVTLFIMPMWINFVIRTWATRDLLAWIGLSGGIYPELATTIGLVYNYLPFAIMPLYTTMLKMDQSQIEAASDLGANPVQVFFKVIIPMTKPGILSAATMVFMPTISSYVIADILGEGKVTLFGKYIQIYFGQSDWNNGSLLALIMLLLISISFILNKKTAQSDEGGVKSSIW
ncbi:MAG: ABC transporter permease [Bacilli bacterium]|jgi:spermidine/putrescine transport system permease protein